MADIQWVQVIAGVVGGGAAGAIITAIATTYRNRIQPVRYRLELKELFGGVSAGPSASVQVMLSDKGAVQAFGNLHQVTLDISNRGNIDRANFKFSLGFPAGTKIVMLDARDTDRNHKFVSRTDVSAISPVDALDFEVKPFNRGNVYEIIAYVADATDLSAADIELTSPAPVSFVSSPSTAELVAGLKPAVEIGLFGAKLTFK
ncbi:hypothetical protein G4G27_10960 [Sphingomonas sp. So64.6b]|uniref:hypothetical protein n=1 Tax=Sphingomonas sp. So64.6b TaxID=2997354 RepID=UPI0016046796|nr:hypothetical protein [Sphingomonas sp. So64.6b]QNA84451.1 hypothetical protein G4G27_10960 [Sphingomonas sp. So64.6b]